MQVPSLEGPVNLRIPPGTQAGQRFRLREIARAREVVVDFLAGSNEYGSTGPSLQKYFDHFALAARRAHLSVQASNT